MRRRNFKSNRRKNNWGATTKHGTKETNFSFSSEPDDKNSFDTSISLKKTRHVESPLLHNVDADYVDGVYDFGFSQKDVSKEERNDNYSHKWDTRAFNKLFDFDIEFPEKKIPHCQGNQYAVFDINTQTLSHEQFWDDSLFSVKGHSDVIYSEKKLKLYGINPQHDVFEEERFKRIYFRGEQHYAYIQFQEMTTNEKAQQEKIPRFVTLVVYKNGCSILMDSRSEKKELTRNQPVRCVTYRSNVDYLIITRELGNYDVYYKGMKCRSLRENVRKCGVLDTFFDLGKYEKEDMVHPSQHSLLFSVDYLEDVLKFGGKFYETFCRGYRIENDDAFAMFFFNKIYSDTKELLELRGDWKKQNLHSYTEEYRRTVLFMIWVCLNSPKLKELSTDVMIFQIVPYISEEEVYLRDNLFMRTFREISKMPEVDGFSNRFFSNLPNVNLHGLTAGGFKRKHMTISISELKEYVVRCHKKLPKEEGVVFRELLDTMYFFLLSGSVVKIAEEEERNKELKKHFELSLDEIENLLDLDVQKDPLELFNLECKLSALKVLFYICPEYTRINLVESREEEIRVFSKVLGYITKATKEIKSHLLQLTEVCLRFSLQNGIGLRELVKDELSYIKNFMKIEVSAYGKYGRERIDTILHSHTTIEDKKSRDEIFQHFLEQTINNPITHQRNAKRICIEQIIRKVGNEKCPHIYELLRVIFKNSIHIHRKCDSRDYIGSVFSLLPLGLIDFENNKEQLKQAFSLCLLKKCQDKTVKCFLDFFKDVELFSKEEKKRLFDVHGSLDFAYILIDYQNDKINFNDQILEIRRDLLANLLDKLFLPFLEVWLFLKVNTLQMLKYIKMATFLNKNMSNQQLRAFMENEDNQRFFNVIKLLRKNWNLDSNRLLEKIRSSKYETKMLKLGSEVSEPLICVVLYVIRALKIRDSKNFCNTTTNFSGYDTNDIKEVVLKIINLHTGENFSKRECEKISNFYMLFRLMSLLKADDQKRIFMKTPQLLDFLGKVCGQAWKNHNLASRYFHTLRKFISCIGDLPLSFYESKDIESANLVNLCKILLSVQCYGNYSRNEIIGVYKCLFSIIESIIKREDTPTGFYKDIMFFREFVAYLRSTIIGQNSEKNQLLKMCKMFLEFFSAVTKERKCVELDCKPYKFKDILLDLSKIFLLLESDDDFDLGDWEDLINSCVSGLFGVIIKSGVKIDYLTNVMKLLLSIKRTDSTNSVLPLSYLQSMKDHILTEKFLSEREEPMLIQFFDIHLKKFQITFDKTRKEVLSAIMIQFLRYVPENAGREILLLIEGIVLVSVEKVFLEEVLNTLDERNKKGGCSFELVIITRFLEENSLSYSEDCSITQNDPSSSEFDFKINFDETPSFGKNREAVDNSEFPVVDLGINFTESFNFVDKKNNLKKDEDEEIFKFE